MVDVDGLCGGHFPEESLCGEDNQRMGIDHVIDLYAALVEAGDLQDAR